MATDRRLWGAACSALVTILAAASPTVSWAEEQQASVGRELPRGGRVVVGDVTFDQAQAENLRIKQASDKAIVDWTSFDIAKGYRVDILQPGATAAMLARVTGQTDSRIAGTLSANGRFVLINPNGIAISGDARIDTGAFTASTLDIADADFLSGKMIFRRSGAARSVVNAGNITARDGEVALLGSAVVNEGVVSARLGRVALGAGDAITLDFAGDQFLQIAVPVSEAKGLVDALGRPLEALVQADGRIEAEGGQIFLSASAARDLMLGAVRIEGDLIANTVRSADGVVRLGSISVDGAEGLVQSTGRVEARGGAGLDGGSIDIRGGAVGLGGVIDSSGDRNGGTVDIMASRRLSLAGSVGAVGLRGTGGAINYVSAGSLTENVYGLTDASGGISGGSIGVKVAGDLATSGVYRADGLLGLGGRIDMTGSSIRLLSTSLSARGLQQGGLVRIGGAFQGGAAERLTRSDYNAFEGRFGSLPDLANAKSTFVNDGVTIDVGSLRGRGGSAIIWSDKLTTMLGSLNAGGRLGGGYAEVSGKETLRYVDLERIDTGLGGTLLLDPRDIVIGDLSQASVWQYGAVIGTGLEKGTPGVPDLAANDQFSWAIALNSAGNRMAVGAPFDDGFDDVLQDSGSVRLYTFTDTSFGGGSLAGTLGKGYTGTGNFNVNMDSNDLFGYSVALNAAGDKLAVGAIQDDDPNDVGLLNTGAVYLFKFDSNSKFANPALALTIGKGYPCGNACSAAGIGNEQESFGSAVALNGVGDRLAVGASSDGGFGAFSGPKPSSGAVHLYTFSDANFGGLTLRGTIGHDYQGAGDTHVTLDTSDAFGTSVALNAAGDRLVVGAKEDDGATPGSRLDGIGAVRLFTFNGTSFANAVHVGTIGKGYTGPGDYDLSDLGVLDEFGRGVALNAAGDRLAVGAPGDDGPNNTKFNTGSVRLFTFDNTSFGGIKLAGTIGDSYKGAGDVNLGSMDSESFGASVALNGAGDRLAVGGPTGGFRNGAGSSGRLRLFTFNDTSFGGGALAGSIGFGTATGYTLVELGSPLDIDDAFGASVALNAAGDRLAVGAYSDDGFDNVAKDSGSVRLFTFANTSFGGGALAGIIGRGYTGTGNLDLGSALEANDQFGKSVALNQSADRLAVGAQGDDGFNNSAVDSGAVRLFTFSNTSFGTPKLLSVIGNNYTPTGVDNKNQSFPNDPGDQFGAAVALRTIPGIGLSASTDRLRLVVGAPGADGNANSTSNAGAVYVITYPNVNLTDANINVVTINPGEAGDNVGESVALNAAGNRLAFGAPGDDGFNNTTTNSGAVYLYAFADESLNGADVRRIGRGYVGANDVNLAALGENDRFGSSVALNGTGDRLAAGAAGDDGKDNLRSDSGAVRLFTFTDTSFVGGLLKGTMGSGYNGTGDVAIPLDTGDAFGTSVALNASARLLAAGATGDDGFGNATSNAGSVRLFGFSSTSFAGGALLGTIGRGLVGPNPVDLGAELEAGDALGASVALNAAGTRLAVGASGDDGAFNSVTDAGSVRLFTFTNNSFGGGALVGTIGRDYSGTGNINLSGFGGLEAGDAFGASVALNAAGDRLAVGVPGDDGAFDTRTDAGSVRLFTFTNTSFAGGVQVGTIGRDYSGSGDVNLSSGDSAVEAGDAFGASVALNAAGDRLAVGATGDDGSGVSSNNNNYGSVRLFTFTNASFAGGALAGTIGRGYTGGANVDLGSALEANDQLGAAVALNAAGNRLALGAPGDDGANNATTNSGAVRLVTFTNTSFASGAIAGTIGRGYSGGSSVDLGTALEAEDAFGKSVALNADGDSLAAGAPGDGGFNNTLANSGAVRVFSFADTDFGGGVLADTLGTGYTGGGNFDVGGLGTGIGNAVAMNSTGQRLVLGAANRVVLLPDTSSKVVDSLAFGDNATGTSNIAASALAKYLSKGQAISFEASNDITISSALTVNNTSGNGGALTLRAGRSILLDANIVTDNGALTLEANTAGSDLATVNANRQTGAANITMKEGVSINAGSGAFSARIFPGTGLTTPTSGDITLGSITAGSISVSNAGTTAGSDVIVRPGSVLTASGTGRAIDIRAETGTFTNNAGAGVFSLTGGGTYAVFSDAPDKTTEGVVAASSSAPTGYLKRYNVANATAFNTLSVVDANQTARNFFAYRIAPTLTVSGDATRFYGSPNPNFADGITGFIDGDTVANLSGAPSFSTTAGPTSPVGNYAVTGSLGTLASEQGYQFAFSNGTLVVTPRPLTVTADALSRLYGNANPALTYTVGGQGLVNGDTLTGALTTSATTASNVGAYAITQGTVTASTNYALTYVGADLTITPRPLTVTADALSRIYGNANPALTYQIGGQGLINNDTLTGALATSATTASNAGAYAITQGTVTAGSNYAITYVSANLTVTPRPITITADAASRIYGNANPTFTYTLGGEGLVNNDTLTGALATSATTASNVGAYEITQGNVTAGSNYAITYVSANLTVTPRPITVTADALSRIYGNANPTLTYTVGGQGLVNGDTLTGALTTSATTASNIGTYGITQGSLAASTNYTLQSFTGADLTVTPRPITVTADTLSRLYGNANPALTYQVGGEGLANGDTLTGGMTTSATIASNVGAYAITQGTLAASSNYTLQSFTGSNLNVTPRPITVTADALSRIYGNTNPALTYQIGGQGLVNNDTLTGALGTSATTASNVGAYAITQGTVAASSNYTLSYVGANLTITPRPITVTADALSRLYGNANPTLTYKVGGEGLVNNDTLTGALATSATTASNVGAYAITQGTLANSNYAVSYTGADLTITPRPITITADALSRIYGNANPALTYKVGGQGLVNGDTLTGALATSATTASNVGAYAITQGNVAASSNYTVSYVGSNLTITPRPITITADALSRIYGNANSALTYKVGGQGLVNNDTVTGTLATSATPASSVGAYAITQGTVAASSNYSITYVSSNLTVTPRPITVTADDISRYYRLPDPALTYRVGGLGLVNGDTLSGSLIRAEGELIGTYPILLGSLGNRNYQISFTEGRFVILPPPEPSLKIYTPTSNGDSGPTTPSAAPTAALVAQLEPASDQSNADDSADTMAGCAASQGGVCLQIEQ